MLSTLNAHERDKYITFDEVPHIYTISVDSSYISATTFNHKQFEKFDADKIINKIMLSDKWEKNKYYGMTKPEIKRLWNKMEKKHQKQELKCIMILNAIIMGFLTVMNL